MDKSHCLQELRIQLFQSRHRERGHNRPSAQLQQHACGVWLGPQQVSSGGTRHMAHPGSWRTCSSMPGLLGMTFKASGSLVSWRSMPKTLTKPPVPRSSKPWNSFKSGASSLASCSVFSCDTAYWARKGPVLAHILRLKPGRTVRSRCYQR